ncbi:DUF721 domain-containing protein [Spirochaetota bacterium]
MRFRFGNNRYKKTLGFRNVLPGIIDELDVKDSFVIEQIRSVWPEVVGKIISEHSIPDRIFRNILFISVDHSIYANELSLMQDSIIQGIKNNISVEVIKNVRAEVKKLKWEKNS